MSTGRISDKLEQVARDEIAKRLTVELDRLKAEFETVEISGVARWWFPWKGPIKIRPFWKK